MILVLYMFSIYGIYYIIYSGIMPLVLALYGSTCCMLYDHDDISTIYIYNLYYYMQIFEHYIIMSMFHLGDNSLLGSILNVYMVRDMVSTHPSTVGSHEYVSIATENHFPLNCRLHIGYMMNECGQC